MSFPSNMKKERMGVMEKIAYKGASKKKRGKKAKKKMIKKMMMKNRKMSKSRSGQLM